MENTDGNTSPAVRVESADSSGAPAALDGIQVGDPLAIAEESVARALDRLRYGRRQEAEGAIDQLKEALACIKFARLPAGERQQGC